MGLDLPRVLVLEAEEDLDRGECKIVEFLGNPRLRVGALDEVARQEA